MDGVYCQGCAPSKKEPVPPEMTVFLEWIRKNPPQPEGLPPFSSEQLEAIRKILQNIIIYHLEKEPKSLHFLRN
jgi:DNA repair protein RecO (recombination protein O)